MTINDNTNFVAKVGYFLEEKIPLKLGVNKKNELTRLIYEICQGKNISLGELMNISNIDGLIAQGKSGLFHKI